MVEKDVLRTPFQLAFLTERKKTGFLRRKSIVPEFNEEEMRKSLLRSGVNPDYLSLISNLQGLKLLAVMIELTDNPESRLPLEDKIREELMHNPNYFINTTGNFVAWKQRDEITDIVGRKLAIPVIHVPFKNQLLSGYCQKWKDNGIAVTIALKIIDDTTSSMPVVIINTSAETNYETDLELHEMTHAIHPGLIDLKKQFFGDAISEFVAYTSQFWRMKKVLSQSDLIFNAPSSTLGESVLSSYLKLHKQEYCLTEERTNELIREFDDLLHNFVKSDFDFAKTIRMLMGAKSKDNLWSIYNKLFSENPKI